MLEVIQVLLVKREYYIEARERAHMFGAAGVTTLLHASWVDLLNYFRLRNNGQKSYTLLLDRLVFYLFTWFI